MNLRVLGVVVPMSLVVGAGADQPIQLMSSPPVANAEFGGTVALDGNLVLVGAENDSTVAPGAGRVLAFDGSGAFLFAFGDGLPPFYGDFGRGVAVQGGTVVVAAPRWGVNGVSTGAAFAFDRASGGLLREIAPTDLGPSSFGASIATDGEVIVIGDTSFESIGTAYLYDAISGARMGQLMVPGAEAGYRVGWDVDVDGDLVAVAAPEDHTLFGWGGSVHLFDRTTGAHLSEIRPSDGNHYDYFGNVIDLDNGLLVVSSSSPAAGGVKSGSVYVFDVADPSSPAEVAKLTPFDGVDFQAFGTAIAVSDTYLAIGSMRDAPGAMTATGPGSVYLYHRATLEYAATIVPDGAQADDRFGASVALDGGRLVVGAPRWGSVPTTGAAFVYDLSTIDGTRCGLIDLASPFGRTTFADLVSFIHAFVETRAAADLAAPFGDWTMSDLIAAMDIVTGGCP